MSQFPAALAGPLQNLFQRNTQVLTRFWTSPEVVNEMRSASESLTREAQASAMKLFQSSALIVLSRDLFSSYSQFWAESMKAQVENAAEVQQSTLEQTTQSVSAALRRAG
jgi:hypothetical protein